jgi:hypothetical protein
VSGHRFVVVRTRRRTHFFLLRCAPCLRYYRKRAKNAHGRCVTLQNIPHTGYLFVYGKQLFGRTVIVGNPNFVRAGRTLGRMNPTISAASRGRGGDVASSNKMNPPQGGRVKLLMFIDNLVSMSNGADFNSLLSMLALACSETVTVVTCLQAMPSTNNRISLGVLTADDRVAPYITQECSVHSIALIWIILYCTHPDGVMKIVDKRICYRTAQPLPGNESEGAWQQTSTSVLEAVATLCGSCIVQHSLHEVLVQAVMNNCAAAHSANFTTEANKTTFGQSGATAEKIHLLTRLLSNQAGGWPTSETCGVHGKRWRNLIEFRLQFDEHDLVTHWTTTMLAAEPEDVLCKPQLRTC